MMLTCILLFFTAFITKIWSAPIEISFDEIIGNKKLRNFLRDLEKRLNNNEISMSALKDIIHIERGDENIENAMNALEKKTPKESRETHLTKTNDDSIKSSSLKSNVKNDAENEFENNMVHKLFDFLSSDKKESVKTSKNVQNQNKSHLGDTETSNKKQLQISDNNKTNKTEKNKPEDEPQVSPTHDTEKPSKYTEALKHKDQASASYGNMGEIDRKDKNGGHENENEEKSRQGVASEKKGTVSISEKIEDEYEKDDKTNDEKEKSVRVDEEDEKEKDHDSSRKEEKKAPSTYRTETDQKSEKKGTKSLKDEEIDEDKEDTGKNDKKTNKGKEEENFSIEEKTENSEKNRPEESNDKQKESEASFGEAGNISSENASTTRKRSDSKKDSEYGVKNEQINKDTERTVRNELENGKELDMKEREHDKTNLREKEGDELPDLDQNRKYNKDVDQKLKEHDNIQENTNNSSLDTDDIISHNKKKESSSKQSTDKSEEPDSQDPGAEPEQSKRRGHSSENEKKKNIIDENLENKKEKQKKHHISEKKEIDENQKIPVESKKRDFSDEEKDKYTDRDHSDSDDRNADNQNKTTRSGRESKQPSINQESDKIKEHFYDEDKKQTHKRSNPQESNSKKKTQSDELASKLKKLITSIKKMNEQSKNPNKILISFDPKNSQIRIKILPQAKVLEEEKKLIIGGMKLVSIFETNMDVLKSVYPKDTYGKIKDVLIYESDDGRILEYWGKIQFHKNKNNEYVDETGFLSGKMVKKFEDIMDEGILTETGFFQSKYLSAQDLEQSFDIMQRLIIEIARIKNKKVKDIMDDEPYFTSLDKMIYKSAYQAPSHGPGACKYVCKCRDVECKNGCTEIKCLSNNLIDEIFKY